MSQILVKSYTEDGFKPIPSTRLDDAEYAKALQAIVTGTADIVPFNDDERVIYLAERKAKPMVGPWYIGGRILATETIEEASARNFKRETGLELPADRFKLAAVLNYRWKDRQQTPQDIGCHMAAYTFVIRLHQEEVAFAALNLEKHEYAGDRGLEPYDRKALIEKEVHPAIIDMYDLLFAPGKEAVCGSAEIVSEDSRRIIREYNFLDSAITDITVIGDCGPLGNHYHAKKDEEFYFAEGSGTIHMVKVDHKGNRVGAMIVIPMKRGDVIRIPAFHAHRFDVVPGTRLFVWNSSPFDVQDLIPHKIN